LYESIFLSSFQGSATLRRTEQDTSYDIRRFFLGCRGNMGVGVESESRREVAQHSGDGLDIYAVLKG